MYTLIRQNVSVLLDAIDPATDVSVYQQLMDELQRTDVTQDRLFQRAYRRYWQLNPARLSEPYLQAYFDLLERLKARPETVTVETVARELYALPTHGNGRQSLQFSFASKLVHMLRPDQPVYDSLIEAFYFLPTGGQTDDLEPKLARLLRSHAFLYREQGRILNEGLLEIGRASCRERV